MNAVICAMLLLSFVFSLRQGSMQAASQAILQAGSDTIETIISMLGAFMLFNGMIHVLEDAGAVRALTRLSKRPLRRLFGPGISEEAMQAVSLNLSANMLGLGNAATPMGLKAAALLQSGAEASPALCLFLVINATSVQLFPTSVIALRAAAGSARPDAVLLPTLVSSAVSTLVGVILCKLCEAKTA